MVNTIFTKCLFILLLLLSNATFANETITCKPLEPKIENKNVILPGVEQQRTTQIYFVQNISNKSVWLDHPVQGRTANAGWSSYIQPQKWSAILINRKNFNLSCAIIQPGEVDYQNCKKSIKICVPQKVAFDSKRKGSYWLAEDKTWDDLLKALEKRGLKTNVDSQKKESSEKSKNGKPVAHHEVVKKKYS